MRRKSSRRRVCFVTGTRAEFGLMRTTLRALRDHPAIELQLIATGVHTHASRGRTVDEIDNEGWRIDATIEWADTSDAVRTASEMGRVAGEMALTFERLDSEIVLVVGDRVEAFAAASAAHVSNRIVAHVHGGDRAMGQADDALRHAISKLAHVHFAATRQSADRLYAMGEDRRRIHVAGAPGIDGIRSEAAPASAFGTLFDSPLNNDFALLLLHPTDADSDRERQRAERLVRELRARWNGVIVALLPNNDPGADGIASALRAAEATGCIRLVKHARRDLFLGLLRDCHALIGNSSAGIIEAGAFGTPVLNVGPRQAGRERGPNVIDCGWSATALGSNLGRVLRMTRTVVREHPYSARRGGTAAKIAGVIARLPLTEVTRRKLIRY